MLGLLLADGARTVECGKTFWHVDQVLFYENNRNSETKSQKIDPEMKPLSKGIKRTVDKIWGHMAKTDFRAQKRKLTS